MELWIRSQNKLVLTKINNLVLEQETINSKVRILQTIQNDRRQLLGEYKNKERTLEVLDEIHNLDIENNPNIKANCYAYTTINLVYQMPQE